MHVFLVVVIIAALAAQALALLLFFFEPSLAYRIVQLPDVPTDEKEFARMIEAIAAGNMQEGNRVDVLPNGECFYEEQLKAMKAARKHIHIEAYIFYRGKITRRVVQTLAERARAGVQVRLVLDGIGCLFTTRGYMKELIDAGGKVEWYNDLKWYLLPRFNHRTHREIMVIDGTIGFVGGAGYADHWLYGTRKQKRWRDSMFRVVGPVVRSLQAVFAENWLEATGEVLLGEEMFPSEKKEGKAMAMVVGSSPSAGRSTRARMLFQSLIAGADKSICIATPYFLPDRGARAQIVRAIRERGVDVKVITSGDQSDHPAVRRSARRLYGELLEAGATIAEYQPTMIHTKVLIIDDTWSVVGSTNFDHRSFGLNDEVNLVACEQELAGRMRELFDKDMAESRVITYNRWRKRPLFSKLHDWFGWVLERQQ